jgi:ribosomal protein L31
MKKGSTIVPSFIERLEETVVKQLDLLESYKMNQLKEALSMDVHISNAEHDFYTGHKRNSFTNR